ncbi:serine hydrolase [soil metagenome]
MAVAAAAVGGVLYARPLLETGSGYAAHNACAVVLVAGRPVGAADDDLPDNPLVPLLGTSVDRSEGRATSSVLGLFRSTAWHTEGAGCTLADERPRTDPPDAVAAGAWPTADPLPAGTADALDAALDGAFAPEAPGGQPLGTRGVVVLHEGRVVAERYADGFDAGTRQLGWSMSKSVTSAMVGRLVADDVLDVDEDDLLPTWRDDARSEITVEDLLRMSSGLAWDETYALGTTITQMLYDSRDMGAFAAAQPLEFAPGTVQEYSSGTTNLLCDVLHERTGMGTELARELVFAPLGMASAVLEPDAAGDLVCSSYLWATPRDWARFGQWYLQGGQWEGEQLLDPEYVAWSTRVEGARGEQGHAAHWWANRTAEGPLRHPQMPADAYWASGHDGQRLIIVPSADLVVVRTGFSPGVEGEDLGVEELVRDAVAALS